MPRAADGVHIIDTGYGGTARAAVYLIVRRGRAALVDAGTPRTADTVLSAMARHGIAPHALDWIVPTHVHLDHGSGAAALLTVCPNACIRAHPRGCPHLIRPDRLVSQGRVIFGADRFDALFGEVVGAPEDRVRPVEDGETLLVGDAPLRVLYTPGHARHHVAVVDEGAGVVFTGDTFGTRPAQMASGRRPFLFCSTPPAEFDPEQALSSIDRIMGAGVGRAALTHFGYVDGLVAAAESLARSVRAMGVVLERAESDCDDDGALDAFCSAHVQMALEEQLAWCGIEATSRDLQRLRGDVRMNATGIAYLVRKRRAGLARLEGLTMEVRFARLTEILPLRQDVIIAGTGRDSPYFPDDDAPDTRHIGVFDGDRCIGCATFLLNEWDAFPAWQLRGMATAPDCRRRGVGSALLRFAERELPARNGIRRLWCNARASAVPFYEAQGWTLESEALEVRGVGLHHRMAKYVGDDAGRSSSPDG